MLVLVLAGVVHGVDLGHAVGQVAEEPRPDLGVDALAGGQEAGDFVHALAETGAVFPQDGGVRVQGGCRLENTHTGIFKLGHPGDLFYLYLDGALDRRIVQICSTAHMHETDQPRK